MGQASSFSVHVEDEQIQLPKQQSSPLNNQLGAFFKAPNGATSAQRELYMRGKDVNPEGKTTNMQDLRHNLITSKYLAWFNDTQFKDMSYEDWKTFICGHMNTGPVPLETTYISVPIIKLKKHILQQQTSHYGGGGAAASASSFDEDEEEEE